MRIGQPVKITADEWSVFGKIGRVIEEANVNGSTRCLVAVDGDVQIFSLAELNPVGEFVDVKH